MFKQPDLKRHPTRRSSPVPPGPKPTNVLNDDDPADQDYTSSSTLSGVSDTSHHSEYLLSRNKPAPRAPPSPPAQPVVIEISDDEDTADLPKSLKQAETETPNTKAHLEYLTAKWGPLDESQGRQAPTPPIRHHESASTSQLRAMLEPIEPPPSFHTKSLALTKRISYHELPNFIRRPTLPTSNIAGGANNPHGPNLPGPKAAGGLRLPGPHRAGGLVQPHLRDPNAPGPNRARGLIPPHPGAPNPAASNRARPTYLPTPRHALIPRTTNSITANAHGHARATVALPRLHSSPQFRTPTTPPRYATPAIFYGSTPKAPSVSPLRPPAKPRRNTQIILSSPSEPAAKPATPQPAAQTVHSSLPSSPELPSYAWLDKTGTSIVRLHHAIRGVLAQGDEGAIRTLARELKHDWEVDEMSIYVEGFVRGALFDRVA
ncbi:uncharacterized protein LAJ45_00959 [Morchella importuna]|uniref:uncharacterized protein n=1 Tax=Morchella importuna TaxID=1174673 RepID=UPI001E8CCB97|nr:uncharacterized protein LAJ45_00959 [Morchella importuna]KAH8154432.1 hypothetical protein LAJ45_00959 [Morchella importuna]